MTGGRVKIWKVLRARTRPEHIRIFFISPVNFTVLSKKTEKLTAAFALTTPAFARLSMTRSPHFYLEN